MIRWIQKLYRKQLRANCLRVAISFSGDYSVWSTALGIAFPTALPINTYCNYHH